LNANRASTRREEIVAETVRLFSEQGYPATTMRDIADAVGLLPGSLYAHVESKESLLLEIIEGGIDLFLAACEPVERSVEPADARIHALIRAYMRTAGEVPEQMLVALQQWKYLTGAGRERVIEKRRRFEGIFRSIVAEGIASGVFSKKVNPRIAVLTLIGALNWAPEWFSRRGPDTPDDIGDQFADVILHGLTRGAGDDLRADASGKTRSQR
jgi:TetR/AcrR family transcriptional regulator, cholesterol catabolism regulator